ncbi:MJ0042 family finger-like domain-containing protein [Roseivivax halotolerans]|uniref:MJ0042 family finger-like domain-containing protein n=1 Tax=Roseivivax halotolerans TaxID=93684 RepID=A0A1I5UW68_9RHOB|nr:zinc-ribbon domain-containing protein [Roseivivax halotolerans]SFP99458.1 MJ0042 family finger-like domain-containing protein [Roseivivax halotolerans]
MRLICPNCGAQYEVPTEVIPEAGRDVQCSNCGHTWFQYHPDHAAYEPDDIEADEYAVEEDTAEASAPPSPPEPEPEPPEEPPVPEAPPAPEAGPAPGTTGPQRRSLDPSVASVLREEAEREAQARKADSGALETQPDLGLDSPSETDEERRARQARERMARMRGPSAEVDPHPPEEKPQSETGSRSQMLPDVDEINQTLRSATDRRPVETPQGRAPEIEEERRGGFSRGFFLMILLLVVIVALYVLAAPLAEMVPALAPLLETYVAEINDLRVWLQDSVAGLTAPTAE